MFLAPGEVQRQHTRNAYSCTQAILVALRELLHLLCLSRAKRRNPDLRRSSSSVVRYLARYFHGKEKNILGSPFLHREGGQGVRFRILFLVSS